MLKNDGAGICILMALLVAGLTGISHAEDPDTGVFSELLELRSKLEYRDQIDTIMKKEYTPTDLEQAQRLGIQAGDLALFKELKDPFKSQLPVEVKLTGGPDIINQPPSVRVQAPTDVTAAPVQVPQPSLSIAGLVWNTKRPQAIVNTQVVGVGDVVNDWEILEINRDGIKVQQDQYQYFIKH